MVASEHSQASPPHTSDPSSTATYPARPPSPQSDSKNVEYDDLEKGTTTSSSVSRTPHTDAWRGEVGAKLRSRLESFNVEGTGITPVPAERRTQTQWWSVGTLWFGVNFNILSFSTGVLCPLLGLTDLKSSLLTIFFFCALCSMPPAYFTLFGPRLGLRQMIQARYSWGYVGACLMSLLSCATMIGYTILNTILGGQTLSAVAGAGHLPESVGMVIVAIVALLVSFSGFRVVHLFERWLWLPVLVCFITLLAVAGTGSSGLQNPPPSEPVAPRAVLGMGTIIAGYLISYSPLSSDVSLYFLPSTSPWKLFGAAYAGFFLSTAPLMMMGAAFACSAPLVPGWEDALETSVGSFFDLVLAGPGGVGGFGKLVTALLAISVVGNIATTLYSFALAFQTAFAWVAYIPRFCFPFIATAIYLPLAIVGAHKFYTTLSNFAAVLSYWATLFIAVVLMEHLYFRRRSYESYDLSAWNDWRRLPIGAAAFSSACISLALLVPSIDQVWYTGPIALRSGDLAFELGFVLAAIAYIPLRTLEIRITGR